MPFGNKPFGLNDVKLVPTTGSAVDLPAARTLSFTERTVNGELRGDDSLVSVVAVSEAVEWELEAGGISLEAYALMTGRTVTAAGTTPSSTATLKGSAGKHFPYFKIYGKSVGDASTDDIHVKLFKCKVTELSGEFADGEFFVTACQGIAVDDGANGIFEFVQNETAAALTTP